MGNSFIESIKVEHADDYLKLLKLQRDFEENKISKRALTDSQAFELMYLYRLQIEELNNKFIKEKRKAFELKRKILSK